MSKILQTEDGDYVVFEYTEAAMPEYFESEAAENGPWFFEPRDYEENEIYSAGFRTAEEAEAAAKEWAEQQVLEAEARQGN
jgi:fructose-1-phosphate kinase PfkB-like protein